MVPGGSASLRDRQSTPIFIPQDPEKTEEYQTKMNKNVEKSRKRIYIEPGTVISLIQIVFVCKGLNDIRMVYNGN